MEFEQSPRDCIEGSLNLMEPIAMVPVDWNTKNRDPPGCPMLVIPAFCSRQQSPTPGAMEAPEKKNSRWSKQTRKNDEC